MTQQLDHPRPERTPNPATSTRPERSSRRIAHKAPLGWLPWAALALIAGLIALAIWGAHEANESETSESKSSTISNTGDAGANAGTPSGAGAAALGAGALIGGAGAAPRDLASASGGTNGGQPAAADVAGTVLFAESSAAIDADGQRVIDAAATGIKRVGATSVEVDGYTDLVAGQPINKPLSQERAGNVAKALQKALGNGVVVTAKAFGEKDPVAPNTTDAGRSQNRRAVIHAH